MSEIWSCDSGRADTGTDSDDVDGNVGVDGVSITSTWELPLASLFESARYKTASSSVTRVVTGALRVASAASLATSGALWEM